MTFPALAVPAPTEDDPSATATLTPSEHAARFASAVDHLLRYPKQIDDEGTEHSYTSACEVDGAMVRAPIASIRAALLRPRKDSDVALITAGLDFADDCVHPPHARPRIARVEAMAAKLAELRGNPEAIKEAVKSAQKAAKEAAKTAKKALTAEQREAAQVLQSLGFPAEEAEAEAVAAYSEGK